MKRRGRKRSLVARLVTMSAALLVLGLAIGSTVLFFVLKARLIEQVDRQLLSTSELLGTTAISEIQAGSHQKTVLPSQYYVMVQDANLGAVEWIPYPARDKHGKPDLSKYDFQPVTQQRPLPESVPNADGGPDWRVVTINTGPPLGTPTGRITIGLPLDEVMRTLNQFLSSVLIVNSVAVTAGVLLAAFSVARALRPLRHIEVVAGQIAAGDLTQRVAVEESKVKEIDSLAASLNAMLAQVERSFENQRVSEQRMRQFVADASHELRTPLATVRGYGELYRLGGIPSEDLPRAFARIESEATRLSHLVNDLTHLARMDEGRAPLQRFVDLSQFARDAAQDLRALDASRPVEIVGLRGAEISSVIAWSDADQVRQILTNLLGNVTQHTPPGTPCEIALGTKGDYAVVEVRDHGPGVEEDHLDRIFERFFRKDVSRSRASGGTGLGLAIVEAIAQANGGRAVASHTPGGGLTVTVELPKSPMPRKDWHVRHSARRVSGE